MMFRQDNLVCLTQCVFDICIQFDVLFGLYCILEINYALSSMEVRLVTKSAGSMVLVSTPFEAVVVNLSYFWCALFRGLSVCDVSS